MTILIRDLLLPLVMTGLVSFKGYAPLPVSSPEPAEANPTDDYDQLDEITTTTTPAKGPTRGGKPQRCNYNPCLENQTSCFDLSASTGCSCPGLTLHNVPPEAPWMKSVSWNGSEVIIQWCAPYSYVTSYSVTVGGKETQMFREDQRSGALGHIDHITEVCVAALNDNGRGQEACRMYHPTDNSLPLKAGLIGGALVLLVLVLLGVLLWHRRQRKQEASISVRDTH
ncbi:leucine-rich repeat neuronal protein 4 [Betta splendens]|uniref:Leucine-rich repeat neuronal protein 4 n=1 Tax=Betta splendens TaxID=158456 RepID=A0A6P7PT81_BETSP|nr:leucine-rich repeat neuronal protein 4 [Betta splendens]